MNGHRVRALLVIAAIPVAASCGSSTPASDSASSGAGSGRDASTSTAAATGGHGPATSATSATSATGSGGASTGGGASAGGGAAGGGSTASGGGGASVDPLDPSACDASQLSSLFGSVRLARQCTGRVTFGVSGRPPSPGNYLVSLTTVLGDDLHPGPFPDLISGYTMVMPIASGSYVSLGFVAANPGQMQLTADGSFGDAGFISISTAPGAFTVADGVVVGSVGPCVYDFGQANSMWFGMNGADCGLTQGATYFVNFADVDAAGAPQCFNAAPGSCASSNVSYQVVSSQ